MNLSRCVSERYSSNEFSEAATVFFFPFSEAVAFLLGAMEMVRVLSKEDRDFFGVVMR